MKSSTTSAFLSCPHGVFSVKGEMSLSPRVVVFKSSREFVAGISSTLITVEIWASLQFLGTMIGLAEMLQIRTGTRRSLTISVTIGCAILKEEAFWGRSSTTAV